MFQIVVRTRIQSFSNNQFCGVARLEAQSFLQGFIQLSSFFIRESLVKFSSVFILHYLFSLACPDLSLLIYYLSIRIQLHLNQYYHYKTMSNLPIKKRNQLSHQISFQLPYILIQYIIYYHYFFHAILFFFQSMQLNSAFELSQLVIFISFYTIYNGILHPDLYIKCFRVVFLSHFSSCATQGKKVASQLRPFRLSFRIMPFLPTYQSQAPKSCLKLTKKETPTLKVGISSREIESNRSSYSADIRAYYPNTFDSFQCENVPMQPLNYPSIIHVTNIGTLESYSSFGNYGSSCFFNLAYRVQKQNLQCCLVAYILASMTRQDILSIYLLYLNILQLNYNSQNK